MTLALNKYKNLCTKYNWLAKSHEEQQIVTISEELDKMKDASIKLSNVFKAKGTPTGKTNKPVNQKADQKTQNKIMSKSILGRNFIPNKVKIEQKMHNKTYNWFKWHKAWV